MKKESSLFWNESIGPMENIFEMIDTGAVLLLPFHIKIFLTIAAALGLSLKDLGRSVDQALALRNAEDILDLDANDVLNAIVNLVGDTSEAMVLSMKMKKEAGVSKLIKLLMGKGVGKGVGETGIIAAITSLLKKAVKLLASVGIIGTHGYFQGLKDPSPGKELDFNDKKDTGTSSPATKIPVRKKLEQQVDLALSL